jgi:hypothetical protein
MMFFFFAPIYNYLKLNRKKTEPPHKKVKGKGLISCDTIIQIRKQTSLEFTIEALNFLI